MNKPLIFTPDSLRSAIGKSLVSGVIFKGFTDEDSEVVNLLSRSVEEENEGRAIGLRIKAFDLL